jgi:LPS-assembly protein
LSGSALRVVPLFISIILLAVGHQYLQAQGVTTEEPPAIQAPNQDSPTPTQEAAGQASQQPIVDLSTIPHAFALPTGKDSEDVVLESDLPQSRHGNMSYASGNVELTYGDHILRADSLTYDHDTEDVTVEGHITLTGGQNDEHIEADHGIYNLRTQTGRFYKVHGSVGLSRASAAPVSTTTNAGIALTNHPHPAAYQTSNPFLFEGRVVVKTGPMDYSVYDGSVTSCLLPHPDWQLFARKISLDNNQAKASNSTFRLLGLPVLFLPYVTHPVDSQQRQSGILIPVLGYSSASQNTGSKGFTFGEQVYLTLGRSADLTAGTLYYSLRGFSENGTVRYRGFGDDFFNAHFSALQDRGFTNNVGTYVNQGGRDITASFRRQFSPHVRGVGDSEYLSSYVYREAFTENFNQAVSTDITSILYLTDQKNGYSLDGRVDRYEGQKVVPTATTVGAEVKIYHAPSIDFTGVDHRIPGTPVLWSLTASAAGMKRVQPNFSTSGITERLDLRPEIALPLAFGEWHILASVAGRETAYSRSRQVPYRNNAVPVELGTPLNRSDIDISADIRPPVIERTFTVPKRWQRIFGDQVRHTIEPEITYRNVRGVGNFLSVMRFDDIDLASDTDEFQYTVTQHLYFRPHPAKAALAKPECSAKPAEPLAGTIGNNASEATPAGVGVLDPDERATSDANGIPNASAAAPDQPIRTHVPQSSDLCTPKPALTPQQEMFSWVLTQKHFFEPTFGGAVINERRNIFDTTLDFSGIAFLTQSRSISPLKSRMRFRTSSHADIAWDFDLDTGAKKFLSSNTFLDVHEGRFFGGFSYARLNAPGRTYTEIINTTTNQTTGLISSAISNFSQMRFLMGYGRPSEPGLSVAGSAGIDLNVGTAQYITVQTSYNWNCCGLSVEYRRYDLGTIRNEGAYRFNFTLANIGSAGNLRRAESLF